MLDDKSKPDIISTHENDVQQILNVASYEIISSPIQVQEGMPLENGEKMQAN